MLYFSCIFKKISMRARRIIVKNIVSKKALLFGAVISSSLIGITGNANAAINSIVMDNYGGGGGSVVCDSCLGFTTPVVATVLSSTSADSYVKPGSPASELTALNGLIALIPDAPVGSVSAGGGAGNSFSTDREYFSVKKGTLIWYFQNTKGPIDVSVRGAEYSHWTEYGESVAEVPIPAAAWLFGSGLIGLVGLKRRRRS